MDNGKNSRLWYGFICMQRTYHVLQSFVLINLESTEHCWALLFVEEFSF